jgi:hypothetical protein
MLFTVTLTSCFPQLDFVYNISLFAFESSIVPSLITLYLYINTSFRNNNNNNKCTNQKEKNISQNHTSPVVSANYTKQSIIE